MTGAQSLHRRLRSIACTAPVSLRDLGCETLTIFKRFREFVVLRCKSDAVANDQCPTRKASGYESDQNKYPTAAASAARRSEAAAQLSATPIARRRLSSAAAIAIARAPGRRISAGMAKLRLRDTSTRMIRPAGPTSCCFRHIPIRSVRSRTVETPTLETGSARNS